MTKNNDPVYMSQYLEHVVEFEKYVWIWTNAMNNTNGQLQTLYKTRESLDNAVLQGINENKELNMRYTAQANIRKKDSKNFKKRAVLSAVGFAVVIMALLIIYKDKIDLTKYGDVEHALIWAGIILFVFSIYNIYKFVKNKRSILQMKKFDLNSAANALVNSRKNQAEAYRAESQKEELQLKEKQNEIFNELQEAKSTLKDMYDVDVLPEKYRSLSIAATLLGYLQTGRCNTVQGHGGIYDTYEKDLQNGTIISRLEEIRDSSLRIEGNQQLLISEMRQANTTLTSINQTVNRIDITTKQIERNTAISAAANQQTAAAASWIAWRM